MAIYCFECGVEVPEEKKITRWGRVFCSAEHARTKRKVAAPPQVKPTAQPTVPPAAPAQAPEAQPATGQKAAAALAAAPPKPPQA
jgi:hypothetical protein